MTQTSEPDWVVAGVEVAASRRATWVALCGVSRKNKRVVVKVIDPLDGTAVTGPLVALWERYDLDGFAVDPRSPSSTLVDPLKAEGMIVSLPDAAGVAKAHGMFIDLLYAGRLALPGHPALAEAMRLAEARRLADQDAIARYTAAGVDMAPLLAAELAVWALGDPETAEGIHPGAWIVLGKDGAMDKPRIAAWFMGDPIAADDPLAAVKRRARQIPAEQAAAGVGALVDALAVESLDIMETCEASGLDEDAVDAACYLALTLRQAELSAGDG